MNVHIDARVAHVPPHKPKTVASCAATRREAARTHLTTYCPCCGVWYTPSGEIEHSPTGAINGGELDD